MIENFSGLLERVGYELHDVIDITVFLVSMNDIDGYNDVFAKYFNAKGPTGTTVAVRQLPHPQLPIELKTFAYRSEEGE